MIDYRKMTPDMVQGLQHMRKRAFIIKNKKGKGSYSRHEKHKTDLCRDDFDRGL